MTKLLLILGFLFTLSTLGFAAANAQSAPGTMVVNGQVMDVDVD
jgi:hypothetical protein